MAKCVVECMAARQDRARRKAIKTHSSTVDIEKQRLKNRGNFGR
jgi:hypothetical protein